MTTWQLTDADRDFVDRQITPYLPDKIFDAHAHLFRHDHYPAATLPPSLATTPSVARSLTLRRCRA